MKRFLVIGLGNFGASVAERLHAMGHEVAALDVDPAKVERVAALIRNAVVGDGTDLQVLDQIGTGEADAAIVSTGDDVTASVLTALGPARLRRPGDLRQGDLGHPRPHPRRRSASPRRSSRSASRRSSWPSGW